MSKEAEYRLIFRGSALAAGGRIRRPDLIIPSQAPALVGASGGHSRASSAGAKFEDIFQYGSAETEVRADYQDPRKAVEFTHGNHHQNRLPARTTVKASVSGLQIINADEKTRRSLTISALSAELTSEWPGTQGETAFVSHRARIADLKLDEYELEVSFQTEVFNDRNTKGKLKHAYESSDSFRRVYTHQFLRPAGQHSLGSRMPEAGGQTYCTIVSRISWKGKPNPHASIDGHKVIFKGFGTIYFGELLISQFSRRLTLMRVELGSPCGGSLDVVELDTDGHGYPPY